MPSAVPGANSAECLVYQKAVLVYVALTYNSDDNRACPVANAWVVASTRVGSSIRHFRSENGERRLVALLWRIRH